MRAEQIRSKEKPNTAGILVKCSFLYFLSYFDRVFMQSIIYFFQPKKKQKQQQQTKNQNQNIQRPWIKIERPSELIGAGAFYRNIADSRQTDRK